MQQSPRIFGSIFAPFPRPRATKFHNRATKRLGKVFAGRDMNGVVENNHDYFTLSAAFAVNLLEGQIILEINFFFR